MEKRVDKVVYHDFSILMGENAFLILGAFGRHAEAQGWNSREIKLVKDQAMEGDYDHLWSVICLYSETVIN